MTQPNGSGQLPRSISAEHELLNRILELDSPRSSGPMSPPGPSSSDMADSQDDFDRRLIRRFSRKVIPQLPRSQTFERQLDERPKNLAPVEVSALERRNRSSDRRSNRPGTSSQQSDYSPSGLRTPSLYNTSDVEYGGPGSLSIGSVSETGSVMDEPHDDKPQFAIPPGHFDPYLVDVKSLSAEEYDDLIRSELDYVWILNLSMHFRDNSKREKFFVTYRQTEHSSRRVTISIDARGAEPDSIEAELFEMKAQRDKNARIYVALRQSLPEIEFFDTVTNLKLQTTDGHLHIHAVEDGNQIIDYPPVLAIKHLQCLRVRERDIEFISHVSCFVYKVKVNDVVLIKKEIPGPETIDEFLYEVNALHSLRFAPNVAQFYGVVVDDEDRIVTGLLLGYAEQGTLQDMIFHNCKESNNGIPWSIRERWARQLVKGLADIHETGFIQGDFTLTNVVIDGAGNAQIIDINRRGCPLKWEPPEVSSLVEAGQRLTLFISDKSDLYQLGMVLWALAMEEDEPEDQGRPLMLGPEVNVPDWYRCITEICLSYDPRSRKHASQLLQLIPPPEGAADMTSEESQVMHSALFNAQYDLLRARPTAWADQPLDDNANARPLTYDPFYTRRGRSPPRSPTQSNTSRPAAGTVGWSAYRSTPSYNSADTRLTVPSYPPENRLLQLSDDLPGSDTDNVPTPSNDTAPAGRSGPSSVSKASHSQCSQDAEWRPRVPLQPRAKLERQQTITPDSYQNREWEMPVPPSVPSWISRVSSPDFEHEGGADLARTMTNESVSVRSDHGRDKA